MSTNIHSIDDFELLPTNFIDDLISLKGIERQFEKKHIDLNGLRHDYSMAKTRKLFWPLLWSMTPLREWSLKIHNVHKIDISGDASSISGGYLSIGFAGFVDKCHFRIETHEQVTINVHVHKIDVMFTDCDNLNWSRSKWIIRINAGCSGVGRIEQKVS